MLVERAEILVMEAHIAFTKNTAMNEFRSLVRPSSTGGAMEHFELNQPGAADLKNVSL